MHRSHILDLCSFLLAHSCLHAAVLPNLAAAKAWTAARLLFPEPLQRTCFLDVCLVTWKIETCYLDVAEDMPKPGLDRTVKQGGKNWGSPIRNLVGGCNGKPASAARGVAPWKGPMCKNVVALGTHCAEFKLACFLISYWAIGVGFQKQMQSSLWIN